jgi:hypothetical protein
LAIALQSKLANPKIANGDTPWCNGNTAPFGGVILGSNPSGVATVREESFASIGAEQLEAKIEVESERDGSIVRVSQEIE